MINELQHFAFFCILAFFIKSETPFQSKMSIKIPCVDATKCLKIYYPIHINTKQSQIHNRLQFNVMVSISGGKTFGTVEPFLTKDHICAW